jgi:hypothetical protein
VNELLGRRSRLHLAEADGGSDPRVPVDVAREGVRQGRGGGARGDVQSRGLEPQALREIDLRIRSRALATQFDERFSGPAEEVSAPGRRLTGAKERAKSGFFAALSPLL